MLSISIPPVWNTLPVIVETPTTTKLFVSNVPSTLKPSIRVCALLTLSKNKLTAPFPIAVIASSLP